VSHVGPRNHSSLSWASVPADLLAIGQAGNLRAELRDFKGRGAKQYIGNGRISNISHLPKIALNIRIITLFAFARVLDIRLHRKLRPGLRLRAIVFLPWMAAGAILFLQTTAGAQGPLENVSVSLHNGWYVHSSVGLTAAGDQISAPGFHPKEWLKTSIPATPIGAQVENHILPSPYAGSQSRKIPGWSYPVGDDYAKQEWAPGSPYSVPWWFLNQFSLPPNVAGRRIYLHFDGINYRANLWVNGHLVVDSKSMAGTYTIFEYDITEFARPGGKNGVALDITGPARDDLSMTFVDWSPMPADRNLGIWRGAWICSSGPVKLRFPQVRTNLNSELTSAELTVGAELGTASRLPVTGLLRGTITPGNITFSQRVTLQPGDKGRVVAFRPDSFEQLRIRRPALWWPAGLGPQNLYTCRLRIYSAGVLSDEAVFRFGVRKIDSGLNAADPDTQEQYRWFKVNNQPVLIKAAGWSYDMLLKYSAARRLQEIEYIRDLNMNAIRMEGTMEDQAFYDLADQYGILIIAGWVCCGHWEDWSSWSPENASVAISSLDSQIRAMRNHPSAMLWMNGSDLPPPANIERIEANIEKADNWPNPVVSNADYSDSPVTGISGVKMKGPYQWVPPIFWYANDTNGGAFGFATEISIGPAVPPMESLTATLDKDPPSWPIDDSWTLHMGGSQFNSLDIVTTALNNRYGPAESAADYVWKSQAENYECTRAMFEAYEANKSKTDGTASTGLVQWQVNKGWPSLHWQLYDWYLRPGGAYFGAKKGSEPLHIEWDYGFQNAVYVTNDHRETLPGLVASADVLNFDLTRKYHATAKLDADPSSSKIALRIPALAGLSQTYFVKLQLKDATGKVLSDNFYWYSTKDDEVPESCDWHCLPTNYADLTALQNLPQVKVQHSERVGKNSVTVVLTNSSRSLAFLIRARVTKGGAEIVPVFWSDNYVSLLPGEIRTLRASFQPGSLPAGTTVKLDGFNVIKSS
jgi:exo-1,4-beta-D-glucosaminidase